MTETPAGETPRKRRRSGSEKRERGSYLPPIRVSAKERAEINARAEAAGLGISAYVRGAVLEAPETKARAKPGRDVVALLKLIAAVNKVGSNWNQIAYALNTGGYPVPEMFVEAGAALLEIKKDAQRVLRS